MAGLEGALPRLTPPDPPLADAGLVLRVPRAEDVPWIVRGCQDPEVPRWTTIPAGYTEATGREFIDDTAVDWDQGTHARFAIIVDGAGAGVVGLHRLAGGQVPEVGYWVGHWARRRGVATRAARLVVDWAFRDLGRDLLELKTMPGNTASERVAAAVGFTKGPVSRTPDRERCAGVDVHVWTLTRASWARP